MTTQRGTAWSVTINNPTNADEENISLARQKGWKVEGQKEKGESGTEHYQLLVKTPQVRFSALKTTFPRSHIELAKNVVALQKYVNKEETRIGELQTDQALYPSLQTTWDMFYEWSPIEYTEALLLTGDQWLKVFDAFISDRIEAGYVLETIAVNPQIRSSIKKFGFSIWKRSQNRTQTKDRQTDKTNVSPSSITNGIQADLSQEEDECSDSEEGSV